MWIMTTDGFFSAVQKDSSDPNTITVRARSFVDLHNLLSSLGSEKNILELTRHDYPYRVILTRDEWTSYIVNAASKMSYSNFKDAVAGINKSRSITYSNVWYDLLEIEQEALG